MPIRDEMQPAFSGFAQALQKEAEKFQEHYLLLEQAMPPIFFKAEEFISHY